MGKINSKKKGSAGELELAHFLTDHGFPARRGMQFQGTPDSPDIICDSLKTYSLECKRTEKALLYPWMEKAMEDAGADQTPVICHRRSRGEWLAILRLEDLLKMITHLKHFEGM